MAETQPTQPEPTVEPHRGVIVLIFGLLGLIPCFLPIVFGILAWMWGAQDLRAMTAGRIDPSGRNLTQAGWVLGIVSVVGQALLLLMQLAAVVLFGAGVGHFSR